MKSYIDRFQSAAFRSTFLYGEKLNPSISIDANRAEYDKSVVEAIVNDFKNGVVTSATALPGHCFAIIREASYVLFEMGIDNSITIGNVYANDRPHFSTTQQSVEQDITEGFNPLAPANAHAWLTLDTGQIVDPTILPSWAYHVENREIEIENAIYLSGTPVDVTLLYEPYLTGFAYHLRVVTHPVSGESFKRYCDWLDHSGIFKRNIAKQRATSSLDSQ